MKPTTLIMAYYENHGMLQRHYNQISALPAKLRDLLHVIIVDDGSPNAPAQPPKADQMKGVALQIYRMEQDVRWNQDACRNIGAHHAETEWLLLTDIDHMVPQKMWEDVLLRSHNDKLVYTFRRVSEPALDPYKAHPNTWLMTRKVFNLAGGYDERFAGLYGTDADFRDRLKAVAPFKTLKNAVVRVPRTVTPDASTTTYLRKQPEDREGIARVKAERGKLKDQTPVTLSFPYHRVHP